MNSNSQLISTRFVPPRIGAQTIAREPLLEKLQLWRHSRLLLVTGSAGYGKTTLLAQWRQALVREGAQVAWLSLSVDDAPLHAFCSSLLGALRHAGVSVDDALPWLCNGDNVDLRGISAQFLNTLAGRGGKLYLMLDDFQHASDPRCAALVQRLVLDLPADVHLVLASRVAPALQLGRLRALGEVCDVDGGQLSFDFREALMLLKAQLPERIDLDTVHAVHALTRGWPIGLQLLAIALKANPRTPMQGGLLAQGSAALAEYLTQDVLAGLPADLLAFLPRLSILRRFNAEVAAHVCETPDAAALIAAIEERNLFIQPVELAGQHWYRLHPLFVEFLGRHLHDSGADVGQLHRRAAHWFERAGLVQEALRHGLLCEDFNRVIELLERMQPSTRRVSQLSEFVRWLEQVPSSVLALSPNLLLLGIWGAVLTVLPARAEAWLAVLEQAPLAPERAQQVVLLKAALAMHRDDDVRCMDLLESLEGEAFAPPFLEQVRIGLWAGCLVQRGHHAQARARIRQGGQSLRADDEMALMSRVTLAAGSLLEGKVLDAERQCAPVLELAERVHGRRSVSACGAAMVMAEACYELDRTEQARQLLANRLDILRFSAPMFMIGAALCQARLKHLVESPRMALDYLAEMEEHFDGLGLHRGVACMLGEQMRLALACGDSQHGQALQARLDSLLQGHRGPSACDAEVMAQAAMARARLALARQQPQAALQVLDSVHGFAGAFDRGGWRVQADLLQAFALRALGREEEARERCMAALASGYRLGLLRTLLDEGDAFQALLDSVVLEPSSVLRGYAQGLRVKPAATLAPPSAVAHEAPMMTRREQQILVLLEQSMSNKHIALALNLSLQTVKWNLKNIFAKLGVSRRYDAIVAMRRQQREQ